MKRRREKSVVAPGIECSSENVVEQWANMESEEDDDGGEGSSSLVSLVTNIKGGVEGRGWVQPGKGPLPGGDWSFTRERRPIFYSSCSKFVSLIIIIIIIKH